MELLGRGRNQRATQNHLGQKAAQPHHGVDGRGDQGGGQGVDLRHHHHMQVLGFLVDIGRALHQHGRVHALHLHVIRLGYAALYGDIAPHEVEREAVAEHVAEVQRQPPGQGLQAEHAQQLGQSRIGLEELAFLHLQMHGAGHGLELRRHGRSCPADFTLQLTLSIGNHARHVKAIEQLAHIAQIELELQLGLTRVLFVTGAQPQEPWAVNVASGVLILKRDSCHSRCPAPTDSP
jgi:hypothetical protein